VIFLKIEEIENAILSFVKERGKVSYEEIEKWAEKNNIGSYTLRIILNDLIKRKSLEAPDGFYDEESYIEPPRPKSIVLASSDYEKLKEYLKEYKSIGILRFFDDLIKMGIKDVNELLRRAIKEGYAELTPSGVVNATEKLFKS
jgi:hypothetical protein